MCLWRGKVHSHHKTEQISREQEQTRVSSEKTDADMDGIHPPFTVRTSISFLLLVLLQTSKAQDSEYWTLLPHLYLTTQQCANCYMNNTVTDSIIIQITSTGRAGYQYSTKINLYQLEWKRLLSNYTSDRSFLHPKLKIWQSISKPINSSVLRLKQEVVWHWNTAVKSIRGGGWRSVQDYLYHQLIEISLFFIHEYIISH